MLVGLSLQTGGGACHAHCPPLSPVFLGFSLSLSLREKFFATALQPQQETAAHFQWLLLHIRNCDWNGSKAVSVAGYGSDYGSVYGSDHMNYSRNPNEILYFTVCVCVCAYVPVENELSRNDKTLTFCSPSATLECVLRAQQIISTGPFSAIRHQLRLHNSWLRWQALRLCHERVMNVEQSQFKVRLSVWASLF